MEFRLKKVAAGCE